jgi:hypothetical protein
VDRRPLAKNDLGLLTWDGSTFVWMRRSRSRRLPLSADLWLTELAIRELEMKRSL